MVGEEAMVLASGEHEGIETLGAAAVRAALSGSVAGQIGVAFEIARCRGGGDEVGALAELFRKA